MLTTLRLLTVIPELFTFTEAPGVKFTPAKVTLTLAPGDPVLGLTDVKVGATEVMLKATELVVPPGVVTLTFVEPDALAAIARVAVI